MGRGATTGRKERKSKGIIEKEGKRKKRKRRKKRRNKERKKRW